LVGIGQRYWVSTAPSTTIRTGVVTFAFVSELAHGRRSLRHVVIASFSGDDSESA
jgi:hypothetical protein